MSRRKSVIMLGAGLLLCAAALSAQQWSAVFRPEPVVGVRVVDAQGAPLTGATRATNSNVSPFDGFLDVWLSGARPSERAALLLFDAENRQTGEVAALEPEGPLLRVVVPLRTLRPLSGVTRGELLIGPAAALKSLLKKSGPAASLDEAAALGRESKIAHQRIEIRVPDALSRYAPNALDRAERLLARGEYSTALAQVDALAGTLPPPNRSSAAAVAAEAAFGYGRTALAASIARSAVAANEKTPALLARLQRVEILAIAEGSESTEPPAERERLRASEPARGEAIERVRDAVLDLRLAILHDRFSREPPRSREAARTLLRLAMTVKPRAELAPVAGSLCRAVEKASAPDEPYEAAVLQLASSLARDSDNAAAIAACAIATGDLFEKRSDWAQAETAFEAALSAIAEKDLPREQREAWYSAATLAARRDDFALAFDRAKRAARCVGRLLSLETDMAAREQLLVNTAGYYGASERFGARAGNAAAAIAVAEAGKGNALTALLHQTSRVDGSALWPLEARARVEADPTFAAETARIGELSRSLGPRDAALSYTMLGLNSARHPELAIGAVTRENTSVTLVEQPDGFLQDVVALARAVEQNDENTAKLVGARLYATLIAPISAQLAGKERLFVSPHLRLYTLPWNALHDGSAFLVHRFAFSRSLPLLLRDVESRERPRPIAGARWLFALNPKHAEHESLPGFNQFAEELHRLVPSATFLGASEATAERLEAEIPRADVMLFAGHAMYDASDPLSSALFTSSTQADPTPRQWPRDRLQARTLLRLQKRLDLAILLGCETARVWHGKSSYSDEVIGLARAFLVTGARHVIGALWPVLDRDAEDFLRAFVSVTGDQDVTRRGQLASRCLAENRCRNRGIASWGSFVVESR